MISTSARNASKYIHLLNAPRTVSTHAAHAAVSCQSFPPVIPVKKCLTLLVPPDITRRWRQNPRQWQQKEQPTTEYGVVTSGRVPRPLPMGRRGPKSGARPEMHTQYTQVLVISETVRDQTRRRRRRWRQRRQGRRVPLPEESECYLAKAKVGGGKIATLAYPRERERKKPSAARTPTLGAGLVSPRSSRAENPSPRSSNGATSAPAMHPRHRPRRGRAGRRV